LYLVDTNVVSEARRGSPQALAWLRSVRPDTVYLRALTLGEIMRGITLRRRTDPQTAARLTEWLERLRQNHADRILPVTDRIALEWGRIAALRSRGDIDGLIAATAMVHELMLVTRNVRDFEDLAVSLINPWSSA
jgi:toxin FitB